MSKPITEAIQQYQAGNTQEAESLLQDLVKKDPNNVEAWHWLEKCAKSPILVRTCLESIVELEPENLKARKRLEALGPKKSADKNTPPAPQPVSASPKLSQATPISKPKEPTPSPALAKSPQAAQKPYEAKSVVPAGITVTGFAHKSAPVLPSAVAGLLDPDQTKAVIHRGSNLLIIAGAGSGKTRTLVQLGVSKS
jgi:hypothetical protein